MSSPVMRTTAEEFFAMPQKKAVTTPGAPTLHPGQRVKARYMATSAGPEKATKWYEGIIRAVNSDGTCDIEYDDGDEEDSVRPEFVQVQNSTKADVEMAAGDAEPSNPSAHGRRQRKEVDYRAAESKLDDMELSGSEEDEPAKAPAGKRQAARKPAKKVVSDEDSDGSASIESNDQSSEESSVDDSDFEEKPKRRKQPAAAAGKRKTADWSPARAASDDESASVESSEEESDSAAKRKAVKKPVKQAAKPKPKPKAAAKPHAKPPASKAKAGAPPAKKKRVAEAAPDDGGGDDGDDSDDETSPQGESPDDFDMSAAGRAAKAAEQSAKREAEGKAAPQIKGSVLGLEHASWEAREKKKWTDDEVDALPVLTQPAQMFRDMVANAECRSHSKGSSLEGLSLKTLASELAGRPIRVATMCSGTESPLLALDLICKAVHEQHGVPLNVEHVFSCEIEPFKQAYIERNFAPPLLFRDIRELDREEATTAYGATRPVPGNVDVLIAGTSCVDYSNLNTKQKTIEQKGESGQTFWGMLGWVRRHRPPIVIQENVCGAPWDAMRGYYAKEGYAATYLRVDTKQHYIPHTRTRVYLLAIDMTAPNRRKIDKSGAPKGGESNVGADAPAERTAHKDRVNELPKWIASINELSRPSSSALEAFLLPTDDPRVHRGRADMSKPKNDQRKVVDWGRCITRHERARTDENLGNKRPLTRWVSQGHATLPDFAWHDWGSAQVERVLDLMDINFLRLASEGVDANFKTMVWNLSQNVDRETGASRPGLCPCLTPNMVPFVTNRGGPLIGHEVLSLQGIPVDDLLLTRESTDQMADLAGNAMTSTIVGTCVLSALLLGRDYLLAYEAERPEPAHGLEPASPKPSHKAGGAAPSPAVPRSPAGGLITSNGSASLGAMDVAEEAQAALAKAKLELGAMVSSSSLAALIDDASRSARMCVSEGRDGVAPDILKCQACGCTVSRGCQGWPEHAALCPYTRERLAPSAFEVMLKAALPMCMQLSGVRSLDEMRPEGKLVGSAPNAAAPSVMSAKAAGKAKASAAPKADAPADGPSSGGAKENKAEGKAKEGKAKAGDAKESASPAAPPKPQLKQMTLNFGCKPSAPPESAEPSKSAKGAAHQADAATESAQSPPKKKAKGSSGTATKALSAEDKLWSDWSAALASLDGARFYFHSVTRGDKWTAEYTAKEGKLRLILAHGKAEWQLLATPPPERGHLRTLLLHPVARMIVDPAEAVGADVTAQLLSGEWELCLPTIRTVPIIVGALGEPVDSWQASIGLDGPWDGHSRYRRWSVKVDSGARVALDGDISGEYELLEACGGAMGSLHKRVSGGDGGPMFFFLDPSRTGKADVDHFVFARSFERLGYGETRHTIAQLEAQWRPWEATPGKTAEIRGDEKAKARKAAASSAAVVFSGKTRQLEEVVTATVTGLWTAAPRGLGVNAVRFDEATIALPKSAPPIGMAAPANGGAAAAPVALPLVRCSVPMLAQETSDWPMGTWGGINISRSKATFGSIAWITERLALPPALEDWTALSHPSAIERWAAASSPCDHCAPSMPKLQWVAVGRGKIVALEDPVQAGAYEQALKRRPQAFIVERRADLDKRGNVHGQMRISANPMSLGLRALALLPPSELAREALIDWRLVRHNDQPIPLPQLKLSSNKHDAAAPQPEHFCKFAGRPKSLPVYQLRIEQQRSLSWMLRQEDDDAPPFIETEVAEAVLPALRWRLEGRARMPHLVRGGVLADEVGYGKTVITVALIDSTPRVPRPPPAPLRADGFVPLKATLVLAPSHLLKQWPREVEKFTGGALKVATIATMADINKLSVRELQSVDVVVCSITLLRNDLYFSRLSNLAGADALPYSKTNQRHFGAAYANAMEQLQEQASRLARGTEGGIEAAREAVLAGQERRKAARNAGKRAVRLGSMQSRMAAGPQLEGVGLAATLQGKKATYAAEKKAKAKAAAAEAAEESEEAEEEEEEESDEESDEENDEVESDAETGKKRKRPAAKPKGAGKSAAEEAEEKDPWGLMSGKVDKDFTSMKAAPLELFYWNRLVVDEYTYNKERDYTAIVHGLKASSRWVLSGTPDISGFAAVSETAQWLGLHLGAPDAADLTAKEKKEQSAVERFQYFRDAHTPAWYANRHSMAQDFLDRYVRQNIAEIDEIPWREQAVRVNLPAAERALYVELKNHLEALDMKNNHKTIKSKCKSENDREARLAMVLTGSDCPEEALLKRCAHFDLEGGAKTAAAACDAIIATRREQLEMCKQELIKQVGFARDAISAFETMHRKEGMTPKDLDLRASPANNFQQWQEKEIADCGDLDANAMMSELVRQGLALARNKKIKIPEKEKNLKDRMAWTRDQVHLLRRLTKEATGRVRSLRFFENVRELQRNADAGVSSKKDTRALLSCCGHIGEYDLVLRQARDQMCHTFPDCKAPARESCVICVSQLGSDKQAASEDASQYGVKLSSVVGLVKRIPHDERILIFVQFVDLLAKVAEALKAEGVDAVMLTGTPNKRSEIIDRFQNPSHKQNDPRVLLLNLRDESAAGANLTAASHAIFVHPLLVSSQQEYNSCDTQAVGRIRRYGQARTVQLYRFLVADSIDEEIFSARREDAPELLGSATPSADVKPLD